MQVPQWKKQLIIKNANTLLSAGHNISSLLKSKPKVAETVTGVCHSTRKRDPWAHTYNEPGPCKISAARGDQRKTSHSLPHYCISSLSHWKLYLL